MTLCVISMARRRCNPFLGKLKTFVTVSFHACVPFPVKFEEKRKKVNSILLATMTRKVRESENDVEIEGPVINSCAMVQVT